MAHHLGAGSPAGVSALCAGRAVDARVRPRPGAAHAHGQLAGAQVGVHVHHAGHLRGGVFRLVPAVLLHELRRRLLAVDAHLVQLCGASRELRVPHQGGQRVWHALLRHAAARERRAGPGAAGRGRGQHVFWQRVYGDQEQGARCGQLGHLDMGRGSWPRGHSLLAEPGVRLHGAHAGAHAGLALLHQQHRRRAAAQLAAAPPVGERSRICGARAMPAGSTTSTCTTTSTCGGT